MSVRAGEQLLDVGGREVGDLGLDDDVAVEGGDLAGGGDGLGQRLGGVGFVEQGLALQVAGLDVVAVDDAQGADAGARQQAGSGRAGGAAAHNGNPGRPQALLSFGADAVEQHLPRVAFLRSQRHSPSCWVHNVL